MLKESCLLTSSFMEKVEEAKYSQVSTDTVLDFCMVMDSFLLSMLAIYLSRPLPPPHFKDYLRPWNKQHAH